MAVVAIQFRYEAPRSEDLCGIWVCSGCGERSCARVLTDLDWHRLSCRGREWATGSTRPPPTADTPPRSTNVICTKPWNRRNPLCHKGTWWWAHLDLNQGPHPYQGCALTRLSYRPIRMRKDTNPKSQSVETVKPSRVSDGRLPVGTSVCRRGPDCWSYRSSRSISRRRMSGCDVSWRVLIALPWHFGHSVAVSLGRYKASLVRYAPSGRSGSGHR